ncbi:MAG: cation transporter [Myxococcales bacterium]|nr:cation transporter [Myxococcales bacterium]
MAAGGHDHEHAHGHDHGHGHAHSRIQDERRLFATLILGLAYMGVEAVGGWLTGSLALVADAGHMLSDAAALGVTLFALRMARRPEDHRRTYGYHRAEVLAAVVNGAALLAIGVAVMVEGIRRLGQPTEMQPGPMIAIAAGGLLVNLIGLAILSGADRSGLNVRGAWLHLLSDSLGSAGAITAGVAVWAFGWGWADPVASLLIALLVLRSAYKLLEECVGVLMETAPAHIDTERLRAKLVAVPGVASVHDVHVWTITSGMISMSGHLVAAPGQDAGAILKAAAACLRDEFGISHSTIQVEPEGFVEAGLHR